MQSQEKCIHKEHRNSINSLDLMVELASVHGEMLRKQQPGVGIRRHNAFARCNCLAYITGTVDQELLLRNEYLVAENRILKAQLKTPLRLTVAERMTLAEIAHRLGGEARHPPGVVPAINRT